MEVPVEHYKVVSSVALCAGMAVLVSAQGNTLATVPPAWQGGQFAGEEIGEYIMTAIHPSSYLALIENYHSAPHKNPQAVLNAIPDQWKLQAPRAWATMYHIRQAAIASKWAPENFEQILNTVTGGWENGKPKALPPRSKLGPVLGLAAGGLCAPWAAWQATQVILAAIAADLARLGAGHLAPLGEPLKYEGGGLWADNPEVKAVLGAWGFVPGGRYASPKVGEGFGTFFRAWIQGLEDITKGEGPSFPFEITTGKAGTSTVGNTYAAPGASVPMADPKEERRRIAAARLGFDVPASAPAPSAGSAAALATGAPSTAVPVADLVKVRSSDGTVSEVAGDPATLLAAIEAALATGSKVALFAQGVGLPPSDRSAHLAALRAAVPPAEEDFFA